MKKFLLFTLCTAIFSHIFASSIAERAKAFQQKAPEQAPVLNGKRDPNAKLRQSVNGAEAATLQLFTTQYNNAAHDPTFAKRQQINLWRIKQFQKTHTTPAFFDASTTGVKAQPEHFQPTLDAANIAMAAAYAPYNNCSRVSKGDVEEFAKAFPHEVTGLNLQSLEGDLLPLSAAGQAFAYNPFSYGMVLTYRFRNADKLQGAAPEAIDLYNKDAAFQWEAAAGIAHEAVGTGEAHIAPVVDPNAAKAPTSAPQPQITQKAIDEARSKLKSIHPVAPPMAAPTQHAAAAA